MKNKIMDKEQILEKILKVLDEKKAKDITTIDIAEKTILADYFVVASGTSSTHIKALADNIEYELKKEKIYPNKIEGYQSNSWILLDYSEVIIHIFTEEERRNYNIEELWEKFKNLND